MYSFCQVLIFLFSIPNSVILIIFIIEFLVKS
jgi:hypothetical protein